MFGFKRRRRARLRAQALPAEWRAILARNVPYYRALASDERRELEGHVQVFLAEKRFEGCGGLALTDEIRVTIAAHACRLLLHRETDYFPKAGTVLVYPSVYVAESAQRLVGGLVLEGPTVRLGESWYRGPVVLSWEDIQRLATGFPPGRNVVLHEFAHQLDSESGAMEGAPALTKGAMYAEWLRVLTREYDRLVDAAKHGRPSFLDYYGATSPAEFFAVAVEAFFEQPTGLRQHHRELYRQFVLYFQQDPVRGAAGG
jgi:Mlc titration factor MtfA (ptsG expression regulator)